MGIVLRIDRHTQACLRTHRRVSFCVVVPIERASIFPLGEEVMKIRGNPFGYGAVVALVFLTAILLSGCQIGYITKQGVEQLRLLSERKPVSEILDDPNTDPVIKQRIRLVQKVRRFGTDELGLRPSKAYRSYIEIDGNVVAYVASASHKDRLEPYYWTFPVVGRFPYKGFFHRIDAEAQLEKLKAEGYDVHLGGATAYSALGWFSDPLYSSMLRMDEIDLAYTILHEMVHGTVYFPDETDFNEQLATLAGWEGALAFWTAERGPDSPEAKRTKKAVETEKRLAAFFSQAYDRLSAYYESPLARSVKIEGRDRIFSEIEKRLDAVCSRLTPKRCASLQTVTWNNASLLAFWRYRYDTGGLEVLYERLGRNPEALIETIGGWLHNGIAPVAALREVLGEGNQAPSNP